MRIVSWNVNGIRAITKRMGNNGLKDLFEEFRADIICFQETKVSSFSDLEKHIVVVEGYDSFWSFSTKKKGYSGVATFARKGMTVDCKENFGDPAFNDEGRVLMTDHGHFMLFNVYFPNGGQGAHRVQYKLRFYQSFQKHCEDLIQQGKHVVICGDVNTAHKDIDVWNPTKFVNTSGFLPEERQWQDAMVGTGGLFIDSFRFFHPTSLHCYTYWDNTRDCRARNEGWRIDCFYVEKTFHETHVCSSEILSNVRGSDHCPISLLLKDLSAVNFPLSQDLLHKSASGQLKYQEKNKQCKISAFFSSSAVPVALDSNLSSKPVTLVVDLEIQNPTSCNDDLDRIKKIRYK